MEFASGGELSNYIRLRKRLSEKESCEFYHQIISAIDYLHKNNIVHRDLKTENILVDFNRQLKIADFGLSNIYSPGQLLKTRCGSPCYAAPEMIIGKPYIGSLVDIWSSGIVLYCMFTGTLPFEENNYNALYKKIIEGKFEMPSDISMNAQDLLKRLLCTDPDKRIKIEEIKRHPFFSLINLEFNQGLLIDKYSIPVDEAILRSLSIYDIDIEMTRRSILNNKHDLNTSTYYLLLKKHIRSGGHSPADLFSKEFKAYLDNPDNLIQKMSNIKTENKEESKKFFVKQSDILYLEKQHSNSKENFINNGLFLTKNENMNSNKCTIEIEIFNKINKEKTIEENMKEDINFKKINFVKKTNNLEHNFNDNLNENNSKKKLKHLDYFINTSISFDNNVDLKNNTYDEKLIQADDNKLKQKSNSIYSKSNINNKFKKSILGSEDSVGMKHDASLTNQIILTTLSNEKVLRRKPTYNYSSTVYMINKSKYTPKKTLKSKVKSLENFINNNLIKTSMEITKSQNSIIKNNQSINKDEKQYNLKIKNFTNINRFITIEKNKSIDKSSDNNYNDQTLTSSNRKPENKNKNLDTIDISFSKKIVSYTDNFKEKQKKLHFTTLKEYNIKTHTGPFDLNCCFYYNSDLKVLREDIVRIVHSQNLYCRICDDMRFECTKEDFKLDLEIYRLIDCYYYVKFRKLEGNKSVLISFAKKLLQILNK